MNYSYEITSVNVNTLSFRCVYTSTSDSSLPDVIKNLPAREFTDSEVTPIIQQAGEGVVKFWQRSSFAPDQSAADALVGSTGSGTYVAPKDVIVEDIPSFDDQTQKVVETIVEDSASITYSYTVVALDSAELQVITDRTITGLKSTASEQINKLDTQLMTAMINGYNINTDTVNHRLALVDIANNAVDSDVLPSTPTSYFNDSDFSLPIDAYTKGEADKQLVQVYASWNGSAAGSYDWSNDGLSSFGVDSVSRIQEGSFRVYFTSPFTDSNYTVTTGVGAENYGGTGASPRQLTVIRDQMSPDYVTVHCERTDDAVDEDNEYMSVIVMGTR